MERLMCNEKVTIDDLRLMKTPAPTATHFPVPHYDVMMEQLEQLDATGYKWDNLEIGVSHETMRSFWIMDILSDTVAKGWNSVWGGRNSHDKSYSLLFLAGLGTWICANLQFTGEVEVSSKHTKHIFDRLKRMVTKGLFELTQFDAINEERVTAYKDYHLPQEEWSYVEEEDSTAVKYKSSEFIHDFVIKSMDRGVIAPSAVKSVLDEWRIPRFEEFAPRTAWSLSNAYTESFKKYSNPHQLFQRGMSLTAMVDELIGFKAPEIVEAPEDIEIDVVSRRRRVPVLN